MKLVSKQIKAKIQSVQSALIAIHKNPDGDACGSALAMFEYLQSLNIKTKIYSPTLPPESVKFLRQVETIKDDSKILEEKYDILICLDTGDPNYNQTAGYISKYAPFVINIDHHETNSNYGALNMTDKNASSTTEILYWFFKWNEIKISPSMATALLTGLITDTDNFGNSATTTTALMIAGELVRLGANLPSINSKTVRNKTINSLKLWGTALSRLNKHPEIDLAHTYLTQKDFLEHGVDEETTEGISNFLNNLEGAKIALVLKETKDGKIKGSLRTTADDVDVAKIALGLGGGGHKKAAGFTADGTVDEILERIAEIYREIQTK